MKKLSVVLCAMVISMFIASTAFGALYNVAPQYIVPSNFGGFEFDLTYDLNTMTATVSAPMNSTATSIALGEWSTEFTFAITNTGGVLQSAPNYTTFPGAANGLTSFVGFIMGMAYNLPIFNWNHDTNTNSGSFALCPFWSPTHVPPPEGVGGFYYTPIEPILTADAGPDFAITRGDQATTVIQGRGIYDDVVPLTYRWVEGVNELSPWQDVGPDEEAYLGLGSIPPLLMGDHTLILEVSDGQDTVSDEMILTINNSIPVADAGSDQAVFDVVTLDGGASFDPDGVIESYQWTLLHREDSLYDQIAEGENPTIEGLEPGFYDVTLIVTDDNGITDTDTMLLAVAGPCETWPQPNAELNIKKFRITNIKRRDKTFTSMLGTIDLPNIDLCNGESVESRITIELFNALEGGGDVVISDEATLKVKDRQNILMIKK